MKPLHHLAALPILLLILAACQTNPAQETAAEPEEAPEAPRSAAERFDPDRGVIPRLEGQLEEAGPGLSNKVDGSDPFAFIESLERIAAESSDEQYRQLDSALRSLQWNRPTGHFSEFAERYDDMSGEEIIEQARQLRSSR